MESDILSLREYDLYAKKFAYKVAKCNRKFGYILQKWHDDIITDLVAAMARADEKFSLDKGKHTQYTFRLRPCRWVISHYIKKWNNRDSYTRPDKLIEKTTPTEIAIKNEEQNIIDEAINSGILSDKQKQSLEMRFVDGITYTAIGKSMGISKQRAEQLVKAATKNIKEYSVG